MPVTILSCESRIQTEKHSHLSCNESVGGRLKTTMLLAASYGPHAEFKPNLGEGFIRELCSDTV